MATRNPTRQPAPTYSGEKVAYGDSRPLDRPDLRARARSAYSIGDVFYRISDATQAKATEQAVETAKRDAATQGVSSKKITVMRGGKPTEVEVPVLSRREGTGAVDRAWNQAAETAYAMRIETATMQHLQQAALDHPADPDALRQSLQGWYQGIKDLVPPDLQARYEHDLYAQAQPLITRAETDLMRNIAHDQAVDAGLYADQLVGSLVVNSSLGAEGAAVSATKFNDFVTATQARIGPFFSEADARKEISDVLSRAAAGSLQAQFEGAPDKKAMWNDFQSGKPVVSVPAVDENGDVQAALYDKDSLVKLIGAEKVQTLVNGLAVDIRMQEAEARAAAAEARARENERLASLQTDIQLSFPDAIAKAEATGTTDMTAAEIYAAYPGERNRKTADKLVAKLALAAQSGSVRKTVAGQGPAEDAAMLESLKPKATDDDFADRQALYNVAVGEVQNKVKMLDSDPATYVMQTNTTVQQAWEAAGDGSDPAAVQKAVATTKQAQIDLGVPPEKVQVMPSAHASGLASTLTTASPDTVAQTIDGISQAYGDDGLNQVIGAGVPPMVKGVAFADAPEYGAWRSKAIEAMKVKESVLKEQAKARGVSADDIDDALEGVTVPLQDTLPAAASQPYIDAVRQVALFNVANYGMDANAAAADAWSVFQDYYYFNGSYRVPKKWDGDQVAGALSNVIGNLETMDIRPAIVGTGVAIRPAPNPDVRRLYPGEFLQKGEEKRTEFSMTVTHPQLNGGRPTNIPSIYMVQGEPVESTSEDQAVNYALQTGETYQSFGSIAEAEAAAKARSASGGRFTDVGGEDAYNFAKSETVNSIKAGHYRWVTDSNEQGVILTFEEGNPVLLSNGEPLRIPFDALMTMDTGGRGGENMIESLRGLSGAN